MKTKTTIIPLTTQPKTYRAESISALLVLFLLFFNYSSAQSTITINGSATSGGTWSGSAPWIFTASGATANIITTDITTKLATGNVTINASTGSGGAGTITLASALSGTIASATQYTLTISAPNAVALGANQISLTGTAGNPGVNVSISGSSITSTASTPGIKTSAGAVGTTIFGNAGSISLTATNGNISIVGLTADGSVGGSTSPGTAGGNGGTITINATGTISTTNISSAGGAASSTGANNGGTGGGITIHSTGATGTITTGTIGNSGGVNTSTGTPGNSGAIVITSDQSSITTGAITTTGTNAAATASNGANAGNVSLSAYTNITTVAITTNGGTAGNGTTGGKGGNGGTISITATTGTYTTTGAYSTIGGAAAGTGSNNGGNGGNVTVIANTSVSTLGITTSGGIPKGTGTTGTSGAVAITSTTSSVSTGGAITTSGTAAGALVTAGAAAGNVTISAGTTLTISTGGISAIGGSGGSSGNGGAGGAGGTVNLTAGSTFTFSTAGISTTGANAGGIGNNNGGNGGSINITSGTGATMTQALTASGGTKTGSGTAGTAGDITLNVGAASTFSGGAAGGNFTKSGSGTLTVSGTASTYTGSTTITAGTIELGAASKLPTTNLILNGGTFSTGSTTGFAQSFGTLTVTANSTIHFGTASHTLTFANSSGVSTWTGNLSITNWTLHYNASGTGGKLSFTVTAGLSAANLAKITFSGFITGSAFVGVTAEVVPYATCTTPTVQPTSLVFTTVNGTVLSGSFTAASTSPSPTKYLILRSTSATVPTPVNGTTYTAGGAGPSSTIVIQASTSLTFSDSGLTKNTTYYYYIYSYNDECVGTTNYLTTSPLSGYTTTSTKNTWYVNDTVDVNDVFTTAAGNSANNGLSPSTPIDKLITLIGNISGSTASRITSGDIIYVDSGTYLYTSDSLLGFDLPVTIYGAGSDKTKYQYSGSSTNFFGEISSSNVKFNNLKFLGWGGSGGNAGSNCLDITAISGNITGIELNGCWFDSNWSSAGSGAVAIVTSNPLYGVTATFNNTIYTCNGSGSFGGAVEIGIFTDGSTAGMNHNITFNKCYFYKNLRDQDGGAIAIYGYNSVSGPTININNCTFDNNFLSSGSSGNGGGAISVYGAHLNVTGSCFTRNYGNNTSAFGSAIVGFRDSVIDIQNSSFSINNASGNATPAGLKGQVTINNGLNKGTATSNGGNNGKLTITKCSFDGSAGTAGAIYLKAGDSVTISQCTFLATATQLAQVAGTFTIADSGNPITSGTFTKTNTTNPTQTNSAVCMSPLANACVTTNLNCTTGNDIFPPVIDETYSIIATDGVCNYIVPTFTATDACDGSPTVTQSPLAGTILVAGTTTAVTITATDASGNSSTATVNVTTPSCPGPCPTQTTWSGSAWSNSAPTTSVRAILDGNYNSSTNGNLDACNLIIKSGVTLTIPDNTYVNVVNSITNNGVNNIAIATKGSLIQVNSGTTGNSISGGVIDVPRISLTKNTGDKIRWDYVYWSKPVVDNVLTNFNTAFDIKYYWDPEFCTQGIEKDYLGWRTLSGEPTIGTGFITRVKTAAGMTPTPITLNMTGVANNGDYTAITKHYHDAVGDDVFFRNFTLLGNPYPGAISFQDFYNDNSASIFGTVYLWSSNTPYPGSGEYQGGDYATFNSTGAVSAPGTVSKPNGYVPSGQGFMIMTSANATVTFKNAHRTKIIPSNDQFFRINANTEKDRFWLRITDSDNKYNEQLIGYIPGATSDFDGGYDGPISSGSRLQFYSIIPKNKQKFIIQGKGTFSDLDRVAIGFTKGTTTSEVLSISVSEKEGIFASQQDVYIHDKELDIYANISFKPYEFTTSGNSDSRFEILYKTNADFVNDQNVEVVFKNNIFYAKADEDIASVKLYDLSGKLVYEKANGKPWNVFSDEVYLSTGIYIAKVTLTNNKTFTRKLIKP